MTQDPPAGQSPQRPDDESPEPAEAAAPAASEQPAAPDEPAEATGEAAAMVPETAVGPPPAPPEAPPRKRRLGLVITLGVLVGLVVVCGGGLLVLVNVFQQDIPGVGACLTDAADANDMDVVDCGAPDAAWTVLGDDGTATRAEFDAFTPDDSVCELHPGTGLALWMTDTPGLFVNDDTVGSVICLEQVGEEPSD